MITINYDNCKKAYELYKQVVFWANRNEFRNTVLAFEEVASFLWDVDQNLSQRFYDLVHSMDDAMYNNINKLSDFVPKARNLMIQVYSRCLCKYYTYFRLLVEGSKEVTDLCESKNTLCYQKAKSLVPYMESIDKAIALEYSNRVNTLINYYNGNYSKLAELTKEYSGKLFKIEVIKLEESFN